MTQKILVTTRFDYADEFDVHGFIVTDKGEYEEAEAELHAYFASGGDELEQYFGTNEYIMIQNYDDYERGIDKTLLTDEEFTVLTKLLGFNFGSAITAYDLVEHIDVVTYLK